MSLLKWFFPVLFVSFPAYSEYIIVGQPQVQYVIVQQPQVQYFIVQQPQRVRRIVQQPQQVQYYRPQPQVQTSTQGSKAYWNGGSYNQSGSFGVKQTYQTGADHQCTHGPNGSVCKNNLHADRQYEFSDNGEAYANGAYTHSGGGVKRYNHNGDPYTVAQINQFESTVARTNETIAQSMQMSHELMVRIKAKREQLLRSRNSSNYQQVDRDLATLDQLEGELNQVRASLRSNSAQLNSR